ncbi:pyrokinin-1 receptor isoform X3 [Ixodes scapularis]|uniref:Pyrokinin-like peptide receptor n=1 Tax=Ixodes scapularis TaxID=6945 RepID=A0A1D8DE71_IXOSC|nr:pyrokinin-1 receptor isoform X3 [Ixodes scapularis]AOS87961.1 pyrokinin-like peptide receptor [Ixodes scapularis]
MSPSAPSSYLDIRMATEGLMIDPPVNASAAETLLLNLGPKRDPLTTVIPMTFIYSILLVSGVIGNVCTCIVIARNRYMHTATNYYLFSLAVSDLLLLVLGLPQELYQLWERHPYVFGEAFCILRGLTSETSTNASILTITAFTIERYVAICHPLRAHTMSKLSRAVKFVVVIWVLSALCAIPLAVQFGIVHQSVDGTTVLPESAECTVKEPLEHAFELSTFAFFLLPMSVILVLYVCIALQLKRSNALSRQDVDHRCPVVHNGKSATAAEKEMVQPVHKFQRGCQLRKSTKSGSGTSSSRKAVINMLIAVVVAFFICWAPFHAQRLMAVYIKDPTPAHELAFSLLTYISGVTYYVSATINPILYSIMSLKFRQAFRDTLMRCCGRRAARHEWNSADCYVSNHHLHTTPSTV